MNNLSSFYLPTTAKSDKLYRFTARRRTATGVRRPFDQTSQIATASLSDVSGSRVGVNSCARNPLNPVSAIAFATVRQLSS
jgi:hypothetical protein